MDNNKDESSSNVSSIISSSNHSKLKRRITPIANSRKISIPHSDFFASDSNESSATHQQDKKLSQSTWDLSNSSGDKKQRKKKQKMRIKDGMTDIINMVNNAQNVNERFVGEDDDNNNKKSPPERPPPPLPRNGKCFLSQTYEMNVKSLFKSMFESETFFEIVGCKQYEGFKNFKLSPWKSTGEVSKLERLMTYEFNKTIAFSRNTISTRQTQVLTKYNENVYGVDTETVSTGIMYSDYFRLDIHYRMTGIDDFSSKLEVIVKIEFLKPCLLKSRIESETLSGLRKYYNSVSEELVPDQKTSSSPSTSPIKKKISTAHTKENVKNTADYLQGGEMIQDSSHRSYESLNHNSSMMNDSSADSTTTILTFNTNISYAILLTIVLTLFLMTLGMFKLFHTIEEITLTLQELESRLSLCHDYNSDMGLSNGNLPK